MSNDRTCVLCGHVGDDVTPGLVAWREPADGKTYDWLDRCCDRTSCRSRVELVGDTWPVDDGTAPTYVRPGTRLEEDPSWLGS